MENKELPGHFIRQTVEIAHRKTWTGLQKGNINRQPKLFY